MINYDRMGKAILRVSLKSVKERQEVTRRDTKRQETFKQFLMLKMSK